MSIITNQNYIYGEQLVGDVDGVNKTFTSLYPILSIEDMRIGGASYSSFSFTGNTITLIDAPTINTGSPYIDYFRSDVINPSTFGNITFLNVINDVYSRLGQSTASRQFPIDLVKSYINEGIRVVNNMRTNPKYKIGTYSFNKAPDTAVTGYSTTEVLVPTLSDYTPSAGKLIIGDAMSITYNTRTTNSFTSLSGLSSVYKSGDFVSIGYSIPGGVKKISEVILNNKVLDFVDRREYIIQKDKNVYTIIDSHIFLPYSTGSDDIVSVFYVKDNIQCIEDTDLIDIENEYSQVLSLYALYNILEDREDDRFQVQKGKYLEQLRLYKSYLRQVDGINNTIPSNIFNYF